MADTSGSPSDAEHGVNALPGSDAVQHDAPSVNEWVSELRRLYVEPKEGAEQGHDTAMAPLRRLLHLRGPRRGAQPDEGREELVDASPPEPTAMHVPPPPPRFEPPPPLVEAPPPRQEPPPEATPSPGDSRSDAFGLAAGSSAPTGARGADAEPAADAAADDGPSPGAWLSSYLEATTPSSAEEAGADGGSAVAPADDTAAGADGGRSAPAASPQEETHAPRGLADLAALAEARHVDGAVPEPVSERMREDAEPGEDRPPAATEPLQPDPTDADPETVQMDAATVRPEAVSGGVAEPDAVVDAAVAPSPWVDGRPKPEPAESVLPEPVSYAGAGGAPVVEGRPEPEPEAEPDLQPINAAATEEDQPPQRDDATTWPSRSVGAAVPGAQRPPVGGAVPTPEPVDEPLATPEHGDVVATDVEIPVEVNSGDDPSLDAPSLDEVGDGLASQAGEDGSAGPATGESEPATWVSEAPTHHAPIGGMLPGPEPESQRGPESWTAGSGPASEPEPEPEPDALGPTPAVPALASRLEAARASREEPGPAAREQADDAVDAPAAPTGTAGRGEGTVSVLAVHGQESEPPARSDVASDDGFDEGVAERADEPHDEAQGAPANTAVAVSWRGTEYMDYLELSQPEVDDSTELIIVEPPSQLFSSGRRRRPSPTEHADADTGNDTDAYASGTIDSGTNDSGSGTPAPPAPVADAPAPVDAPADPPRPRTGRWTLVAIVLLVLLVASAAAWYLLLRDDDSSTAWGSIGPPTPRSTVLTASTAAGSFATD